MKKTPRTTRSSRFSNRRRRNVILDKESESPFKDGSKEEPSRRTRRRNVIIDKESKSTFKDNSKFNDDYEEESFKRVRRGKNTQKEEIINLKEEIKLLTNNSIKTFKENVDIQERKNLSKFQKDRLLNLSQKIGIDINPDKNKNEIIENIIERKNKSL